MSALPRPWHLGAGLLVTGLLLVTLGKHAPAAPPAEKDKANKKFVEELLKEIQVPELLFCPKDQFVFKSDALSDFDPMILQSYPVASGAKSKLKPAVTRARALLWSLSGQEPPAGLADTVKTLRAANKVDFKILRERYPVPANANQFKNDLFKESKTHAAILQLLLDGLEELQLNSKDRDDEPRRWRANYDFIEARLMLQIAQVYEYQSMIGMMRKELPAYDPKVHSAWHLTPRPQVKGDFEGKRLTKEAHQLLSQLTTRDAVTPWAVIGQRLKDVPIGLEWQAVK